MKIARTRHKYISFPNLLKMSIKQLEKRKRGLEKEREKILKKLDSTRIRKLSDVRKVEGKTYKLLSMRQSVLKALREKR